MPSTTNPTQESAVPLNHRRRTYVAALGLTLLTLTGCTDSGPPAEQATPSASPTMDAARMKAWVAVTTGPNAALFADHRSQDALNKVAAAQSDYKAQHGVYADGKTLVAANPGLTVATGTVIKVADVSGGEFCLAAYTPGGTGTHYRSAGSDSDCTVPVTPDGSGSYVGDGTAPTAGAMPEHVAALDSAQFSDLITLAHAVTIAEAASAGTQDGPVSARKVRAAAFGLPVEEISTTVTSTGDDICLALTYGNRSLYAGRGFFKAAATAGFARTTDALTRIAAAAKTGGIHDTQTCGKTPLQPAPNALQAFAGVIAEQGTAFAAGGPAVVEGRLIPAVITTLPNPAPERTPGR